MENSAGGVVGEIYAKHRNSTQPESQQVCAVLGAVLEVVQAEGLQPTPTALFAALMSSLEKPETQASSQVRLTPPERAFPSLVCTNSLCSSCLCPTGGWSNVHLVSKRAWQGTVPNIAFQI